MSNEIPKWEPCCTAFPAIMFFFDWMRLDDGTRLCPTIGHAKWRINACPSCGADVRDTMIPFEQWKEL